MTMAAVFVNSVSHGFSLGMVLFRRFAVGCARRLSTGGDVAGLLTGGEVLLVLGDPARIFFRRGFLPGGVLFERPGY